jgi:hypothetical protein
MQTDVAQQRDVTGAAQQGHPPGSGHRTQGMKLDLVWAGPARSSRPLLAQLAFVAGALLVLWSAYIHFHLWQSVGYKHIATIGPLFLAQWIGGLVLGVLVAAVRRVWAAILGVGFALVTIAGFLVTVDRGLFGFKESWAAPFAHEAFYVEIAAAVILLIAGALCLVRSAPAARTGSNPAESSAVGA